MGRLRWIKKWGEICKSMSEKGEKGEREKRKEGRKENKETLKREKREIEEMERSRDLMQGGGRKGRVKGKRSKYISSL